ncbi:MAG: AAA family ATPase, partial [Clostridia bacterium]|nr:AAA family ATPase [Clostridia bacterium]
MLKLLEIENVAVIEKASVTFAKGLNVLTGETGAGKSIVIDSINAVTGQKTSRELVRAGAAHAFVSALFEDVDGRVTERLAACGVPAEADGTVLLQRTLYKDGKNLCRVNGVTVTVSMLKSVGEELINIHGQRDSQALLDAARHIDFLDSFAGLGAAVAAYAADYARLRETQKAIRSLQTDEAEKARRIDLLTWQINELTEAAVTVGEREELHRKKNILTNSLKLASALTAAVNALSGDGESAGAAQLLAQAAREITSVASVAKGLDAVAFSLEEAENTAADAAAVIEDVLGQLDNVEGSLDAIEERLDKLYRLSKSKGMLIFFLLIIAIFALTVVYRNDGGISLGAPLDYTGNIKVDIRQVGRNFNFYFLMIIPVFCVIVSEFNEKTWKNTISSSTSRARFYIQKFVF